MWVIHINIYCIKIENEKIKILFIHLKMTVIKPLHVNTNNIFYEKNLYKTNESYWKERHCFTFL